MICNFFLLFTQTPTTPYITNHQTKNQKKRSLGPKTASEQHHHKPHSTNKLPRNFGVDFNAVLSGNNLQNNYLHRNSFFPRRKKKNPHNSKTPSQTQKNPHNSKNTLTTSQLNTKQKSRTICARLLPFCGERGIRTPGTSQFNGFQDRRIRPLCHLSYLHFRSTSSLPPTSFSLQPHSNFNHIRTSTSYSLQQTSRLNQLIYLTNFTVQCVSFFTSVLKKAASVFRSGCKDIDFFYSCKKIIYQSMACYLNNFCYI